MVADVDSYKEIGAYVVDSIQRNRFLSCLDVEKDLAHTCIDFLHQLLQTSSPAFFESTALWLRLFSHVQELDRGH